MQLENVIYNRFKNYRVHRNIFVFYTSLDSTSLKGYRILCSNINIRVDWPTTSYRLELQSAKYVHINIYQQLIVILSKVVCICLRFIIDLIKYFTVRTNYNVINLRNHCYLLIKLITCHISVVCCIMLKACYYVISTNIIKGTDFFFMYVCCR